MLRKLVTLLLTLQLALAPMASAMQHNSPIAPITQKEPTSKPLKLSRFFSGTSATGAVLSTTYSLTALGSGASAFASSFLVNSVDGIVSGDFDLGAIVSAGRNLPKTAG